MTAIQRWSLIVPVLLLVAAWAPQGQQASSAPAAPRNLQVIINLPPAAPTIQILIPTSGTTFDAGTASTIAVSGIGTSLASITGCTYSNNLGGSGTTVSTPNINFSIASLALTVGDNVLTITCTDVFNQIGTDVLTITRSGGSVANPITGSRMPSGTQTAPDPTLALAGVEGGIPTRTTICTTLGTVGQLPSFVQSTTVTQINSAITACPAGLVVLLSPGTYNLTSAINNSTSHVVLRGSGADQTKLIFSGSTNNCNYFDDAVVSMCGGLHYGQTGQFGHSAAWSAGYAAGTSTITVADKTGMAVGSPIALDQLDEAADGYPAPGDVDICTTQFPCTNQGGGFNAGRQGRSLLELTKVTSIEAGACAPSCDIGITPPIYGPTWRAGQTPQVWWSNAGTYVEDIGLEDLSIDFTAQATTGNIMAVFLSNCMDCWVKGTRILMLSTAGVSEIFQIGVIGGLFDTIESNYLYGNLHDYHCTNCARNQNYAITLLASSSLLIQNNILQRTPSGVVINGPVHGSVVGYNYVLDASYTSGGTVMHGVSDLNLHEGNDNSGILGDVIHAPHHFETAFRNFFSMDVTNASINVDAAFALQAKSRFWNIVGNVSGKAGATTYETTLADCGDCHFKLGWQGNDSAPGGLVANDTNVKRTLLRWGNYDTATAASRFLASEVPSGIANFPNAVPGSQALPISLYLSTRPPWVPSARPWPLIGPDVTGGDITGYGGHANKIPARVCSDSATLMPDDPAYAGVTVRLYNRVACYGA